MRYYEVETTGASPYTAPTRSSPSSNPVKVVTSSQQQTKKHNFVPETVPTEQYVVKKIISPFKK